MEQEDRVCSQEILQNQRTRFDFSRRVLKLPFCELGVILGLPRSLSERQSRQVDTLEQRKSQKSHHVVLLPRK